MVIRALLMTGAAALLLACGGGGNGGSDMGAASISQGSAGTDSPIGRTAGDAHGSFAVDATVKASAADLGDAALRPLAVSPLGLRPSQVPPNSVQLQSDWGDFVGGGNRYSYSNSNATIAVAAKDGSLTVNVVGNQNWRGDFVLPSSFKLLQTGTYYNLTRYPFHVPAIGGLNWSGEGRGCNVLSGSITINSVAYSGSALQSISLSFEQHCENQAAALRGQVFWSVFDGSVPAGPQTPIPAGLWSPPSGSTPSAGSYIYLASDPGDYIGAGRTYAYSRATASLAVSANGGTLSINVDGDQNWRGSFAAMKTLTQLQPGYYADLQRYPFHNPVKGGLDWSGEGRGCNTLRGWFVVDAVTYAGTQLRSIDLRFEQHCEGGAPALRGKIHWTDDDSSGPAGPINPPPAGLWAPALGTTPSSGNYVHLVSDMGDSIGAGKTYTYTRANASLSVASQGSLSVGIYGDQNWTGNFVGMNTLQQLQPGYYGDLQRYPFHNPVKGGLSWYGEGRGCNTLTGWFVVDAIEYAAGQLQSVDLRFEQHCEGRTAALRGQIHWAANDSTTPPGPVNPPPADLWSAPADATPPDGDFVFLASDRGDYIGGGSTSLYTAANSNLVVYGTGNRVTVGVAGWIGDFVPMNTLSRLQPGYYADLRRYPFHNPVKGGLNWGGNGRGCNTLRGWFVVDAVSYVGSQLRSIDLRFEQHCEGVTAALRGRIRWGYASQGA